MNKIKEIIRNKYTDVSEEARASVAYTVCGVLTKCLSLITLPIFTRILTTEEYGLSTVYSSTVSVVMIFISLQLAYGSLSTAMIKYDDDRKGYLSSISGLVICLTFFYIIFTIANRKALVDLLEIPFGLIILMGIEALFSTIRDIWMGGERFEYNYKGVVFITLVTSISSVVISFLAVFLFKEKGLAKIFANTIVVFVVGLVLYIIILKSGHKFFDKKYWKFALTFNIPLIPYYLSQMIFNQSDRLMINKICGISDAALYGVAYSLATILTFVVVSINNSYVPWIFERIKRDDLGENKRVTLFLSLGIAFMLLGIIALAPEIIYVMAGDKYMPAIYVVPPVTMSVLLLYYADLFDCFLFFYECKFLLSISAIISALLNIVLNYIFIPKFGFLAAGYTTLFSYFVLVLIDYIFMKYIFKVKNIKSDIYNIKGLIITYLCFMLLGFTAMALYSYPIVRYFIIIIVLTMTFIFRKRIIKKFNEMKGI